MGLSHYPTAAEGMVPVLVMSTLTMVRWVLKLMGCDENLDQFSEFESIDHNENYSRKTRGISITLFKSLLYRNEGTSGGGMECCVCLHGFEGDEQVSELSCKHFFHKGCLQKWLDHRHSTCPLCRCTF